MVAVEAMVVMAVVVGAGQQFRQRIAGAGWGYSRQQAVALVWSATRVIVAQPVTMQARSLRVERAAVNRVQPRQPVRMQIQEATVCSQMVMSLRVLRQLPIMSMTAN